MFQVRGIEEKEIATCAFQVELESIRLNNRDVFIIITPKSKYIWQGKDSTREERTFADQIVHRILPVS